ncbi:hypothetical protein BDN70DRAFT_882688 [Pholiota conissans]|uniref:Uncharacterized protein n=1 Tax=Pholiota conissans TaxID=109636 RepID=A0A9P5YVK3_9AGAR|nr:hypothetical protein BDN70DRAFT_882688 [Pholiota conissans]
MELLGTFLAAIAFGIVAVLVLSTLQILLGKTRIYSRTMQLTLLCYIFFMSSMSLLALVQQVVFTIKKVSHEVELGTDASGSQIDQTVALPFAIWGADIFLLWRCTVLYRGVSKLQQAAVLLVVFTAGLSSLGSGIFFFFTGKYTDTHLSNFPTVFAVASSGLVNILLRTLIVSRILYHQRYVQKAMGTPYASIYTKIMTMCVESCAMTSICGAVFLGLYYSKDEHQKLASVIPLILLPHICILTPLLLVYRVARGRNVTTLAVSETVMQGTTANTEGAERSKIRFKNPVATSSTGQISFVSGDYRGSTQTLDNTYFDYHPSASLDCVETDVTHVEYQRRKDGIEEVGLASFSPASARSSLRFQSQIYP